MKASAYPLYKKSGEAWLGDVPAHWELQRIKHSLSEKKSKKGENLPCGAISFGNVVTKDSESIPIETRQTYQEVLAGEYLINPINLNYDLKSLRTALSSISVCVSPAYIVVKPNETKILPKYGEYLLHLFDIAHMKTLGAGVRQTITFKDIGNCIWCLPPLIEQEQITAFLNRETTRIDSLIEKKTRFIELLKEKRQAVITKAVTKGLDSSVPMKNSGVKWLGQVPKHWAVTSIKRIVSTPITDGPHETPVFHDSGVPFVSAEAVSSGDIDFSKIRGYITPEEHLRFSKKYRPQKGDIYMVKSGATTGVTAMVVDDTEFNIWSPLAAIRCGKSAYPRYILAYMRSRNFLDGVALNWSYGTQQNIGMGVLGNLSVTLPSLDEQISICSHLDAHSNRINTLIRKTEQSIVLLKEHRSALITAAVTGKIDVRISK